MKERRDLELLYEIGSLRHLARSWKQMLGVHVANDLEHTIRVVWIALLLARRAGKGDELTIMKMALVHDIGETRTGDANYVQRVYVDADEKKAVNHLFTGTMLADYEEVYLEYARRDSLEAKFVKDADNLDVDIELKELEEQGHLLPKKWNRRKIRDEKLYTDEAKQLWDELQDSEPSSWHRTANKWKVMPDAGR